MAHESLRIAILGDCMLGRLVNAMLLRRATAEGSSEALQKALASEKADEDGSGFPDWWWPAVRDSAYVWGGWLPRLLSADLRVVNLETSVTAWREKAPGHAFNFRMHPVNVDALLAAKIDFCSLANNHVLDFGLGGMRDTLAALRSAGIACAGAGETRREAAAAAVLQARGCRLLAFSAADHFEEWAAGEASPGIHLLHPDKVSHAKLLQLAEAVGAGKAEAGRDGSPVAALLCIHWGPNYCWQPSAAIQRLAHCLVDVCGFDLIVGTSAHHVQGVELYHGAPILYGCGDFVDDYRVDPAFRSDLSFLFLLEAEAAQCRGASAGQRGEAAGAAECRQGSLRWRRLNLFPSRIARMQATDCVDATDRRWLFDKMTQLCASLNTEVWPVSADLSHLAIDFQ